MISKVIKGIVAAGALLVCQVLPAQKFTVDGSVELYSAYVWRGDKVCGAQISPFVNFHYGAWTLQSFGFLAIDNSYKEIDWDLSYNPPAGRLLRFQEGKFHARAGRDPLL